MSETTDYLLRQATAMESRKQTILSSHNELISALKTSKASAAEIAVVQFALDKQLERLNRMQQAYHGLVQTEALRDAVGADHLPHFGGMVAVLAADA